MCKVFQLILIQNCYKNIFNSINAQYTHRMVLKKNFEKHLIFHRKPKNNYFYHNFFDKKGENCNKNNYKVHTFNVRGVLGLNFSGGYS